MSVAELDMADSGDINDKMEREGNQKLSDEAIPILQAFTLMG